MFNSMKDKVPELCGVDSDEYLMQTSLNKETSMAAVYFMRQKCGNKTFLKMN